MKKRLDKLLKNAHGEYSGVKVSSVAIDSKGFAHEGVNVENAAYPSGICAERNAMNTAISTGVKPGDIKEIHLTSNVENFLYPCGACLQVMAELCSKDLKIFIYNNEEIREELLITLFPNAVKKESF
ncbi:MAG: cytidine deaminase [Mycoplasmataceae bacterium]|nr:cytidine deaminase [Mycoplasmataceae bacterium]